MNSVTIKNVTFALVLGALGSGLWSTLGEPFLGWFVENFVVLAQSVNDSFYDSLHEDIGKALHEDHSLYFVTLIRVLFTFVIFGVPFVAYKLWKRSEGLLVEKEESLNKEVLDKRIAKTTKSSKHLFVFSILLCFVSAPVYISRIITSEYNNNAIVFTERSIEIISPKITNLERLELISQYRSVSSASDFYELYDNLINIANKHSIKLPKFEVAR